MSRLPCLLLVLFGTIAAQVASNQTDEGSLKTDAAEGHRHHHKHHDRSHSGEHHRHHHDHGYGPGYYQPQIHDRYVCDLDASVLLVLSRSRGGLHKAHRVRCSDVAAADEDSCTVCCQNAARRDTSLANENIYGILTDTDGFEEDKHHSKDDDKPNGRYKRGHGSGSGEHNHHGLRDTFPNGEKFPWKYGAPNWFKNVKCLCCAPRRQYSPQTPTQIGSVQIPVPQYSQPQYTPPQYSPPQYSPPQYSPPQYSPPQYSPPQYAPPQYQPPAQAPPAPVYQQPTYVQPVAQAPPVYQPPQPQYQQPTYDQPTYNQQASPPVAPAAAPVSSY